MLRQTALLLVLAACVLGASLPVRRLAHTGPRRGLGRINGRITGGQDAAEGQFPYQVSLQWVLILIEAHNCGGSIISETAVLTAGHCVMSLGHYNARAGDWNLNTDQGTEQEIRVTDQIASPVYPGGAVVAEGDIAVFTLESPFTLNDVVQIIALPTADTIPEAGSTATLSGWGTTGGLLPSAVLQYVEVSIIDFDTCYNLISTVDPNEENPLTETMVCTGPVDQGISACSGDSGGPLAQNGELIGVVSWGFTPCGLEGAPSVFTRVSAYIDFINENL